MGGSSSPKLRSRRSDFRKLSTDAPILVDGESMELVQPRPNSGMTLVLLLVCTTVLFALAAVVRPALDGDAPERRTLAAVERVASLVRAGAASVIPEGHSWLHGPGPLPAGAAAGSAWPLRRWLSVRDGRAFEERLPLDGWGRAIAVIPVTSEGPRALLVVSAGPDGVMQSSSVFGIGGDDIGQVIFRHRSG